MRNPLHLLIQLILVFVVVSCRPKTESGTDAPHEPIAIEQNGTNAKKVPQPDESPPGKPIPPLPLAAAEMPERLGDLDFKSMKPRELTALADTAAQEKNYTLAATAQYWLVQKSASGQYDLACYLALEGRIDPAFYWLQIAAFEEGVESEHAQQDADLTSLQSDPRWLRVLNYLSECNRYFETASVTRTVVILPTGYEKPTPVGAILWLHGVGSRPEDLVNEAHQAYADTLNMALIGASGTKAQGLQSFEWADEVEANAKRLRDALDEVSDRVTLEKGHIITLGFSQGAQVGLEVAVRFPEDYAGSIVLSPGGAMPQLHRVHPSPLLARRGYVLSCNANEHPGNVLKTAMDAAWLREANAKVIHKAYPGVSSHSFPRDFNERFPEWVKFILEARGD